MNTEQRTGRVLRSLPDKRVVVLADGKEITARASGLAPRRGADVLIVNPGNGWVVASWH
ncbi:hypothetical protein [Deinococcus wulumuqiensis]|uniref:Uncharacterized protein n=2 Tax=Deinococcus wulumuqiensis TaxID=980427 RepID=A0AAV4K1J0_9DEIO|nr:hypothetical protein [Deinococcus wulumuqiensis]QII20177.1 hypothetical protein G6R31_04890 [Deinococcus wulumuqiensis R12]GGI75448.1 hypothetical protein GCM10010914_07080 [Deinococcus wulumuqiensis]GGP28724.1 hypothetical protein GCM10008021_03750 [Deinococcus wulumuqiensis]